MKSRNYYVYGDSEKLNRLAEEYRWIGRDIRLEEDRLVVLALPPRKSKRKNMERNDEDRRDESGNRREVRGEPKRSVGRGSRKV